MATVDPALLALRGYIGYQNAKYSANKVSTVISNKNLLKSDSLKRQYISQETSQDIKDLSLQEYKEDSPVVRKMAGRALNATSNVTSSMYNNKALFGLTQLAGQGTRLAGSVIGNKELVNAGSSLAKYAGVGTNVANTISNINPMYYATNKIGSTIFKSVAGAKPGFTSMMLGNYAMMAAMPLIQKSMSKASNWLQKREIESAQIEKMPRMGINPKYKTSEEFMNVNLIQDTFNYINRYQDRLSPYEMLNLQLQSQIVSNTSALPVLTAEFINQFIRKDVGLKQAYNKGLENIDLYNEGIMHQATLTEHAYSMRRGEMNRSVGANLGIALGEGAAFLNKFSFLTDIVRQIAVVARGGNIMDEAEKGDLKYNNVDQRRSATYSKTLGIEENTNFASAYFGIQKSASEIIASAKSYEEVQVSLTAGIYDATRISALELSTLRTKAYSITKPINYTSIGAASPVKDEGIMRWMSNKIPLFGMLRMMGAGTANLFRMGANYVRDNTEWESQGGVKGAVGKLSGKIADAKVYKYNNKLYNQMAQGFDYRRDTSWAAQAADAIGEKINEALLSNKLTAWMGKANRMSLEEKEKMKYQDTMGAEWDSLLKEAGMEQLSDQAAFYRYGTIDLPKSMDLQTYYLSTISIYSRATMENTAVVAQVNGGRGYRAEAPQFQERKLDLYTGKLLTAKEQEQEAQKKISIIAQKAEENARETEKSYSRFFRFFTQDDEKFTRRGEALEGTTKENISKFEKSLKDYFKFRIGDRELYTASERARWTMNPNFQTIIPEEIARDEKLKYQSINPVTGELQEVKPETFIDGENQKLLLVDVANISAKQWRPIYEPEIISKPMPNIDDISGFIQDIMSTAANLRPQFVPKYDTVEQDLSDAQKLIAHQPSQNDRILYSKIAKILEANKQELTGIKETLIDGFEGMIEVIDESSGGGTGGGFLDDFFGNNKNSKNKNRKTTKSKRGIFKKGKSLVKNIAGKTIKYGKYALPFMMDGIGAAAGAVATGAGAIASAPVMLGAAALAAAGGAGYGLYKLSIDDDSEEIMDKLEHSGVVEHNFFGDSMIKDWNAVSQLSEKEIDALIRFDDWSDEDKKRLEILKQSKESLTKKSAEMFNKVKQKTVDSVRTLSKKADEVIKEATPVVTQVYANASTYATTMKATAEKEAEALKEKAINTYQTSALVQNVKNGIDEQKKNTAATLLHSAEDEVAELLTTIADKLEDLKAVSLNVGMQNVAATYEAAFSGTGASVKGTELNKVAPPTTH